jgi:hypothetical protein
MPLFGKDGKRRQKLSKMQKSQLPPQPKMVMVLKDGKKRMERTGEYLRRS